MRWYSETGSETVGQQCSETVGQQCSETGVQSGKRYRVNNMTAGQLVVKYWDGTYCEVVMTIGAEDAIWQWGGELLKQYR
jgi:hypothetical protein